MMLSSNQEDSWSLYTRSKRQSDILSGLHTLTYNDLGIPSSAPEDTMRFQWQTMDPPRAIDVALWNRYWARLSGDLDPIDSSALDPEVRQVASQGNSNRAVSVALNSVYLQGVDARVEFGLKARVLAQASSFGVVEFLNFNAQTGFVILQFTTAKAAAQFYFYAEEQARSIGSDAAPLFVLADTLKQHPSRATSDLVLGKGYLGEESKKYIEALFVQSFGAKRVVMAPLGNQKLPHYIIQFASVEDAAEALHLVSRPLAVAFGLCLSYCNDYSSQHAQPLEFV